MPGNTNLKTIIAALCIPLAMAACSSDDGGKKNKTEIVTLSGVVVTAVDPYLTGCVVTDSNGTAATEEDPVSSPGQYQFNPQNRPVGTITLTSCTDAATGLTVSGLSAGAVGSEQNYATISPITALIQAMVAGGATAATAESQVRTLLGISASIDLATYDPIAAAAAGDTDGMAITAQGVKIMNAVNALTSATGASFASALTALATATISATSDPLVDATVLTGIAEGLGISNTAATSVAGFITAINTTVDTTVTGFTGTDTIGTLTAIVATNVVVSGEGSNLALVGADDATATANLDAFSSDSVAIDAAIAAASINTNGFSSIAIIPDTIDIEVTGGDE